uniref:Uncharacterized protein n=1 Tax=Prymnesium polylepis TaxID=72548 RepID=A0A7S4J9K8_9EUKA|eukprot:2133718-Prymnesium_polylepis.1
MVMLISAMNRSGRPSKIKYNKQNGEGARGNVNEWSKCSKNFLVIGDSPRFCFAPCARVRMCVCKNDKRSPAHSSSSSSSASSDQDNSGSSKGASPYPDSQPASSGTGISPPPTTPACRASLAA